MIEGVPVADWELLIQGLSERSAIAAARRAGFPTERLRANIRELRAQDAGKTVACGASHDN